MSVLGSCSILYDIWSDWKRKLQRPYYRILLGMSCIDAITSFWLGLSTWPIPRGTAGVYAPVGTTATCTAQGFFIQLMVISPFYNLMLSVYYLFLGKYKLTEEEISKRYERYMHGFSIALGVGFAIIGLPLNLYNNANLWCWIATYPPECENNAGKHGDMPCERGHNAWLFRWIIFYGPIWLVITIVTVLMIMLTNSIRAEEKQVIEMQKQRPSIVELNAIDERRVRAEMAAFHYDRYERSRQMFHQAVFYLGVFYITWLFVTINRLIQLINGSSFFPLMVLHSIFGPLQGFFNFIVYRHGPCIA